MDFVFYINNLLYTKGSLEVIQFSCRHDELIPDIELNSNDLLTDLARIGLGIAFVPDYCVDANDSDLAIIPTKEKLPARQMVVSVNTVFPVSASTEEFLKLLPTA